jgi:hypothetical protein
MSCQFCQGLGVVLYKEDAPSPPYKQGSQLEYAMRCVCVETKGPNQNYNDSARYQV